MEKVLVTMMIFIEVPLMDLVQFGKKILILSSFWFKENHLLQAYIHLVGPT